MGQEVVLSPSASSVHLNLSEDYLSQVLSEPLCREGTSSSQVYQTASGPGGVTQVSKRNALKDTSGEPSLPEEGSQAHGKLELAQLQKPWPLCRGLSAQVGNEVPVKEYFR